MKVYGAWTVHLLDETFTYDPDNWLGSVWNQLDTDLGMTIGEFNQALARRKPLACQWLIWYLRRLKGDDQDRLSVDFPLLQFRMEEVPDEGEADAADTPPSEPNTSSPSSNDSGSDQPTGTT